MSTIIIGLFLLLMTVCSLRLSAVRLAEGCCGGSGQPYIPKVKVQDRNRFHYPYHTSLNVSGMSSGNSAVCVENALNSIEGVWAKVNLLNEKVSIYMKQEVDEAALRIAVKDAGYVASRVQEN